MGADKLRRGRPPKKDRMDKDLNVRVAPAEKQLFERAAKAARKSRGTSSYSAWVREALIQAANRELANKEPK